MIRKYSPTDFDQVVNLLGLNTPQDFHPTEEADFFRYLHADASDYFVFELLGKIAGCGGINFGFENGRSPDSLGISSIHFTKARGSAKN